METGQSSGATVADVSTVSAYIRLNANNSVPGCPANGTYATTSVGSVPEVTCSLSTLSTTHALQ